MKVSFFAARLLLVLSALLLAACSTGKIVKAYDGDELLAEQLAVLTAPEGIAVLSINGKKLKKYLLDDINVNYGLKPGENLVVFQYGSVWAKAVREDKDAPRSEKVTSEPKEVLIDAKAGEKLNFRFKSGSNAREAKVLAAKFEAEVVDSKLNTVARSAEVGTYVASNAKVSLAEEKPETSGLQTLDALKVLWKAATAEEKKTFLAWAFQK